MTRTPDTCGSHDPDWIARCRADIAEYDSYVPKIAGNGRTGSTRVPNPKVVLSKVHPARTREER